MLQYAYENYNCIQHKYLGSIPCPDCYPTHMTKDSNSEDMVNQPSHYDFFPGVEAIIVIARSMSEAQFRGYCMGNALKYRLRAGKKWNTEEDLKKADAYVELYDKYRTHCGGEM